MNPDELPEPLRRTIDRLEHIVLHGKHDRRPTPTIREYIAHVSASVPAGSRNTYSGYWKLVEQAWGEAAEKVVAAHSSCWAAAGPKRQSLVREESTINAGMPFTTFSIRESGCWIAHGD
nr:hypothetical protein [Nocardia exalbida]